METLSTATAPLGAMKTQYIITSVMASISLVASALGAFEDFTKKVQVKNRGRSENQLYVLFPFIVLCCTSLLFFFVATNSRS